MRDHPLAPAHTRVIFAYTLDNSVWDQGASIWDDGESIWDEGLVVEPSQSFFEVGRSESGGPDVLA
jgi:hypothetical protein